MPVYEHPQQKLKSLSYTNYMHVCNVLRLACISFYFFFERRSNEISDRKNSGTSFRKSATFGTHFAFYVSQEATIWWLVWNGQRNPEAQRSML